MPNSSKVYFTSLETDVRNGLVDKMEKLARAAGIDDIALTGKLAAIKIHFGEPGNLAFLRHNYAARMAKLLREFGASPFLTDAGTLYRARRSDAVSHLIAAAENGYSLLATGCPIIIADGLRGYDHHEIEINCKHFQKAYIASAVVEADVLVTLNHFKGHMETGFGGAIKNIGMGCGSREGKHQMHCASAPKIKVKRCVGCQECIRHCNYKALSLDENHKATMNTDLCVGCGQCVSVCRYDAVGVSWDHGGQVLGERIAEYALATLMGKDHFHVSVITDVSPHCDCADHNGISLVPDIGILVSKDPLALDAACADLVVQAPINAGSQLDGYRRDNDGRGLDKFEVLYPEARWRLTIEYAESIGVGNSKYELIHKEF